MPPKRYAVYRIPKTVWHYAYRYLAHRDVPPINKTALSHITDDDFKDLNDFVTSQCYQFEANMKNFHYISVANAEYMWDIDNREDGDHGFVWNFTYSNQLENYDQDQLEEILNIIGWAIHYYEIFSEQS